MDIQEVLQELRELGWGDTAVGRELGVSRETVYRWRTGQRTPENERPVLEALRRLLRHARRVGPARRKDLAGTSPARSTPLALRRDLGPSTSILASP
jgi:hypothetical protein